MVQADCCINRYCRVTVVVVGMTQRKKYKVCWLSAGISSFIAGYLAGEVDEWIYIDISDQHPDSLRFIEDCEKVIGKKVTILRSAEFDSVEAVARKFGYLNSPYGAACTGMLKKAVRKKWECEHTDYDLTYVWGMDMNEKHRAERLVQSFPEFHHEFPLIDRDMSKEDAHGLASRLGLKRPMMYDLGYSNNNCIGCVKAGMGYWNQIRKDFPKVFEARAKLEREIGHSCMNGMFLDELPEDAGRMNKEIMEDCGIMCYLAIMEERG